MQTFRRQAFGKVIKKQNMESLQAMKNCRLSFRLISGDNENTTCAAIDIGNKCKETFCSKYLCSIFVENVSRKSVYLNEKLFF